MQSLVKYTHLIILSLLFISCDDDNNTNASNELSNIVEIAQSNNDLSLLVEALTKADLVGTVQNAQNVTVFAPTNQAFTNFLGTLTGINSLDDFDTADEIALLRNVLLNHVVGQALPSTSLSTTYTSTLAVGPNDAPISLYVNTSNGVVLNGVSTVITADVQASNGIVHVVNEVIGLPTVVTFALADANFSSLVAALTRDDQPDFVSVLSGNENAPFTVFAPVDVAFTNLINSNESWSSLADVPQVLLTSVLQHHVIAGGNVRSNQLSDNLVTPNTLEGDVLTVRVPGTNGAVANLVDGLDNADVEVVATDVQAINGVIHAINKVLIPDTTN
jgi:uncharacterized surface protein with fasciclin (FAS1) repeats